MTRYSPQIRRLLAATALVVSAAAAAQDATAPAAQDAAATAAQDAPVERFYHVELVVFRHTEPAPGGELWERPEPPPPEEPFFDEGIAPDLLFEPRPEPDLEPEPAPMDDVMSGDEIPDEPLTAETVPFGTFELLPDDAYQLGDAVAKLSDASRFSPLAHAGWVQSGVPEEESLAKDIAGSDNTATVSGRAVLSLSRYLHLDVDLQLATAERSYRLRQSRRRIQTGRYHYIDHPMFGVIAIVTRAPTPTPTE